MNENEIRDAVQEYVNAVNALHVMHSSGDVHNMGGVATASMTPHCAWQCNAIGLHDAVAERVHDAKRRLMELGLIW